MLILETKCNLTNSLIFASNNFSEVHLCTVSFYFKISMIFKFVLYIGTLPDLFKLTIKTNLSWVVRYIQFRISKERLTKRSSKCNCRHMWILDMRESTAPTAAM